MAGLQGDERVGSLHALAAIGLPSCGCCASTAVRSSPASACETSCRSTYGAPRARGGRGWPPSDYVGNTVDKRSETLFTNDMTSTTCTETTTFTIGQIVTATSPCDSDCVWTFEVIARTAKFVTLREESGETVRVGVRSHDGEEWATPFGRFSMAPVVRAGR